MAVTATEARAKIVELRASSTKAVGRNMAFEGDSVLVTAIVKNIGAPGILLVEGTVYVDNAFYDKLEFPEEEEVEAEGMGYFSTRFEMPDRDCRVEVRAYHRRDSGIVYPRDDKAELTVHLAKMIKKVEYPEEAFPGDEVAVRFRIINLRTERKRYFVLALVNGEKLESNILELEPGAHGVLGLTFTMPDKAEVKVKAMLYQDISETIRERVETWSGTIKRKEVRAERRGEAPIVISEEEYHKKWEPQGWKLLVIGPTATWRREWAEWEALRDIYQNSLDEAEAYTWGYDDQGLWIADEGKGVAVRDFLLGPPKPKPDWARGKFGEGMKIAALALLRRGYSVKIDTADREFWIVFLRQELDGRAEQLAALWRPDGKVKKGTRWHIIGYFGPAYEDRIAVNIPRRNILFEAPSLLHEPKDRRNQLIDTPPGRIYARDIYMRDIDSPWSYVLWDFEMAPDRHAPKREDDVNISMGRLWACCTDVNLLKRFLSMIVVPPREVTKERDVSFDYMGTEPRSGKSYIRIMTENGDVWREAWRREFGDNVILRTSDRLDPMVRHLGYESVSVTWSTRDALAEIITTDTKLVRESQERLSEVEVIPDEKLGPQELAHLNLARAIAHDICYGLEGVDAAVIPPASDRARTAGMYDRRLKMIYIGLDQLSRARTTIDTVIHEIAHHTSGAEDGTEAHNREMTRVAAQVVERTAKGRYDGWLKGVRW